MSESQPIIEFEKVKIVEGPLSDFEKNRKRILKDVFDRTVDEFQDTGLDLILSEAAYQERMRIKGQTRKLGLTRAFTLGRILKDQWLWGKVRSGLIKKETEQDRVRLLRHVVRHYAEEIGGHFSPRVYDLATRLVPWGFNWLLNAASFRQFVPWKVTQALQTRLQIVGEVEHLRNLSQRGTILLVPTHQSNIDSILIGYVIYLMSLPPFAYGAGLNLFTNPIFSFFMSNLGSYTVDRAKKNQVYKHVLKNYSTRILQEGVHSVFYPGGGRSRSGAVETDLKLGLLGTGLEAQVQKLKANHPHPSVFIVPMVTSYEFVLEAGNLIEDYLLSQGKHLFMGSLSEEPPPFVKTMNWFWKFFSSKSSITVRLGKPLDVFGNFVDEFGNSVGPNGTTIDPKSWLTTCGELREEPQRDREYTRQLGKVLVDRYYSENTIISAHLLAFSFFMSLRKRFPHLDLYRFLRLSLAQRSVPYDEFLKDADEIFQKVKEAEKREELHLSRELHMMSTPQWVEHGMKNLGLLHDSKIVRVKDGVIWTEEMNLLYYYRNRLSGYGISLYGVQGRARRLRGECDEKGFLA